MGEEAGGCPRLAGAPQHGDGCSASFSLVFSPGHQRAVTRQCCRPLPPTLGAESGSGKLLLQSTPLFISNKRLLVLLSSYATFKNSKLSPLSEPFNCKNPPCVAVAAHWHFLIHRALELHQETVRLPCSRAPSGDSVYRALELRQETAFTVLWSSIRRQCVFWFMYCFAFQWFLRGLGDSIVFLLLYYFDDILYYFDDIQHN